MTIAACWLTIGIFNKWHISMSQATSEVMLNKTALGRAALISSLGNIQYICGIVTETPKGAY